MLNGYYGSAVHHHDTATYTRDAMYIGSNIITSRLWLSYGEFGKYGDPGGLNFVRTAFGLDSFSAVDATRIY